jgi:hypothetical protein
MSDFSSAQAVVRSPAPLAHQGQLVAARSLHHLSDQPNYDPVGTGAQQLKVPVAEDARTRHDGAQLL